MDLLAQAKQLEKEFEQQKSNLEGMKFQQALYKQQFVEKKNTLAEKNITFTTGAELQQIYLTRQQRLQELIQNHQQTLAQQSIAE